MPTKITKIIKNENDSVVLSFKTTFNTPLHIILPTIIRFIAYGTDIHSNPYNRHIPVKGHVRGCHIFSFIAITVLFPAASLSRQL